MPTEKHHVQDAGSGTTKDDVNEQEFRIVVGGIVGFRQVHDGAADDDTVDVDERAFEVVGTVKFKPVQSPAQKQ